MTTTLQFWHGSQRWEGRPRHNPSRPGCYECGPGLYLTTRVETARKYSRGAGKTVRVELDPDIHLLEDATLTLEQMVEAVGLLPRVRNRAALIADLKDSASRHPNNQVPAIYLVNLCVNHEALLGKSGPVLSKWLAEQGIDASIGKQTTQDQWIVVFNLEKIRRARPVTASEAWDQGDFLPIAEQRAALTAAAASAESVSTGLPEPEVARVASGLRPRR